MADQNLDRKAALVGEALLCGLLGRILYDEMDRGWLQSLIDEDVFAEAPFGAEQEETRRGVELLHSWAQENRGGISDEDFSALKQDHLQLFIGTDRVPAPAWESVYFSEKRQVFGEQTVQVRQWYSRFGLQAERLHREPDDHIGLELSFMAHLAGLALQAVESDDQHTLDQTLQAQRDFLREHLLRWGPGWARLAAQHAETTFYRGLAHLTHGALLAMAEHLEVEVPKEVAL